MPEPDPTSPGARSAAPGPATAPPDDVGLWLVDGYNVIHAVLLGGRDRAAFWVAASRDALVARIERLPGLADGSQRVVVVFDGQRDTLGGDGGDDKSDKDGADDARLVVRFAPSADDFLVRAARGAERPAEVGVVTTDRQVAGRCRHAGARVVTPRAFLGWCPEPVAQAPERPE